MTLCIADATADAVEPRAGAERRNDRAEGRRVAFGVGGFEARAGAVELGSLREGGFDKCRDGGLGVDELPGGELGVDGAQVDAGVEAQAFGEACGGDAALDLGSGEELAVAFEAVPAGFSSSGNGCRMAARPLFFGAWLRVVRHRRAIIG